MNAFYGEGESGKAGWRKGYPVWAEKGTVPLRPADWEMYKKSGLAGGCGPGALGLP